MLTHPACPLPRAAQENSAALDEADSAPAMGRLSLADDAAWAGADGSPDGVLPLPPDFAAGQMDPQNLFNPDAGAPRGARRRGGVARAAAR